MNTLKTIENLTDVIADIIVNFDKYRLYQNESLDEFLSNNFLISFLECNNKWAVAFGYEFLIDGLDNQRQALDLYYFLEKLAYSKTTRKKELH